MKRGKGERDEIKETIGKENRERDVDSLRFGSCHGSWGHFSIFYCGNIDIQLLEPQYDESESERVNITPNKELTKDPQIQNKGNNDAFVFLKVTVPKADVKVASQDNQTFDQSMQELFDYSIDGNWSLVKTETGEATDMHVYVYGTQNNCTVLAPGATTSVLFKDGKIKFKNVVEGQGLDETTLEMPVEAFAIQTTDLAGNGTTNPAEVWALLEGNTASN